MSALTRTSRSRQLPSSQGGSSTVLEFSKSTSPVTQAHRPLSPSVAEPEALLRRHSLPAGDTIYLDGKSVKSEPPLDGAATPTVEALIADHKPVERRHPLEQQEHDDGHSSSLSELEDDEIDDTADSRLSSPPLDKAEENDTEAETERLEATPRKPGHTNDRLVNGDSFGSPSPTKAATTGTIDIRALGQSGAVMGLLGAEAASHAKIANSVRKRKRTTSCTGTDSELDPEQPARKRSRSPRSADLDLDGRPTSKDADVLPGADEKKGAEHSTSSGEEKGPQVDEVVKTSRAGTYRDGLSAAVLGSKKGKRKAKKQRGERADELDEVVPAGPDGRTANDPRAQPKEEDEATAAAAEEQDDASLEARTEEHFIRKKIATNGLAAMEKHFAALRDKLYNERLQQLSHELSLLEQPNPTHPEYLKILRCVDQRRDEKIKLENVELKYKHQGLENKVVAERAQALSQYFQEARELRSDALEQLGQQWYCIQSERRQWHDADNDYKYLYHPKRSQQILQQTAYNLEVSILSGIAKYRGFPAAPEMEGLHQAELDSDLRGMNISLRPRGRLYQFVEPTAADRVAAEEQFLQQTPWANPRHPQNHEIYLDHRPPLEVSANPYNTPATSQRIGLQAPNGSASTASDPSSAFGSGNYRMHNLENTLTTKSSPLSYAKRQPFSQSTSAAYGNHDEDNEKPGAPFPEKARPAFISKVSAVHQAFPTSAVHAHQAQEVYESPSFAPGPGAYGTPMATPRFEVPIPSMPPLDHARVKSEDDADRLAYSPPLAVAHHAPFHAAAAGIATGGTYGRWRA